MKILIVICISICAVLSITGCTQRENLPNGSFSQGVVESSLTQTERIEASAVSETLKTKGYKYEASDGKNILLNGTHWIDDNHILICEGDAPVSISIIDITSGASKFTFDWNVPIPSISLILSFGRRDNTVVLIAGEHILTISCDSYSASESIDDNYIEFTSKRASSGWDAVQQGVCKSGIPVTLLNTQMGKEIQAFAPDGKAYWLTSYAGWSPNGEYLLVSPEDGEENDLSGLAGPYEGKFAVIDTNGITLFSFRLLQGDGKNPEIMWTSNNTLLVYRIDRSVGRMTVQEFFPITMSETQEIFLEECDNVMSSHSGKDISLLYGNNKNIVIAYNRRTGERTSISVPATCSIRVSPDDRRLLIAMDNAIWIQEIK